MIARGATRVPVDVLIHIADLTGSRVVETDPKAAERAILVQSAVRAPICVVEVHEQLIPQRQVVTAGDGKRPSQLDELPEPDGGIFRTLDDTLLQASARRDTEIDPDYPDSDPGSNSLQWWRRRKSNSGRKSLTVNDVVFHV